jgi:Zn finger protein HypA/HybF involved in hydrogenase expression
MREVMEAVETEVIENEVVEPVKLKEGSKITLFETGTIPECRHCHGLFSTRTLKANELVLAHKTGLCSKCQKDQALVEKYEKLEVTPTKIKKSASNKVKVESTGEKPGKVIRDKFMALVSSNKVDNTLLSILTDEVKTKESTGIRYAFLKEVDINANLKDQALVKGKLRYSAKVVDINGKNYFITNDLYAKNVQMAVDFFDSI